MEGTNNYLTAETEQEDYSSSVPVVDITLKKTTDTEGEISGYKTLSKTGDYVEGFVSRKISVLKKTEIEKEIDAILDIADDLVDNINNPILLENLLSPLISSLDELWLIRNDRERELAKLIILIQTVIGQGTIDTSNKSQIKALFDVLQGFRKPKIAEIDIKDCRNILKEAQFDLYKPLKAKKKLKISIEEE